MQISNVRNALAVAASAVVIPGATGQLACTGYVPDAVTPPCFFVAEYTQTFDEAMNRGLDTAEFTCRVLVGRSDDRTAQKTLDAMLSGAGTASLKSAIEAARGAPGQYALGGAAHDLRVTRTIGPRWYEHAGTEYVGGELTVYVIGSGVA